MWQQRGSPGRAFKCVCVCVYVCVNVCVAGRLGTGAAATLGMRASDRITTTLLEQSTTSSLLRSFYYNYGAAAANTKLTKSNYMARLLGHSVPYQLCFIYLQIINITSFEDKFGFK